MYYLIGGSGAPNYGDELILANWLRFLHDEVLAAGAAGNSVTVDNNSVHGSTALFGHRYPEVRFVSSLKRLKPDPAKGSFMKNLAYGLGFFSQGHWRRHPEVADAVGALRSARLAHLYGGGYINTVLAPASAFLIGLLADAAREFHLTVVATGIGITPLQFAEGENLAPLRQALEAFSLFELRDAMGFNRVRQIVGEVPSLLCGQDDAFLYPVERQAGSEGKRRLHLSGYRSHSMFELPEVATWLREQAPTYDEVVYWECAPHLEREVVEQVRAAVPGLRVAPVQELLFAGIPAQPGDYMLTMRYHPHLVAARLGVSGQFMANSVYYEHKHGAVVQMGSRFRRWRGSCLAPEVHEQALAWRDGAWVQCKRLLAHRLYGSQEAQ
jgi:polysaccharide pyruvyl transferase WcaK-like protein